MTDVAIRADNLSKQYRIGERETYRTFRDAVSRTIAAPLRSVRSKLSGNGHKPARDNQMWALRDLSFEIKKGETVGVIGRNGAGKSTLLKLLSRITEPTTGYADINGRVGSLLEVGTGFHQELSGRENIFLNGAIIGMKRAEINRKFDDIVAFAEVERFIDTPVKHYSSGMYLRLAFSVAAHLEPEILLVDEVLAVGDVAFQRKCLGKMEDVAAHGRTVLFVSHNLGAVRELCQTSIILDHGRLDFRGNVVEGLAHYTRGLSDESAEPELRGAGWHDVRINGKAEGVSSIESSMSFTSDVTLDLQDDYVGSKIFMMINDAVGSLVVHQRVTGEELRSSLIKADSYQIHTELPALWLAPGIYSLHYKFLGQNSAGKENRYFSERVMLDVTANVNGIGRAILAPPPRWTITSSNSLIETSCESLCAV